MPNDIYPANSGTGFFCSLLGWWTNSRTNYESDYTDQLVEFHREQKKYEATLSSKVTWVVYTAFWLSNFIDTYIYITAVCCFSQTSVFSVWGLLDFFCLVRFFSFVFEVLVGFFLFGVCFVLNCILNLERKQSRKSVSWNWNSSKERFCSVYLWVSFMQERLGSKYMKSKYEETKLRILQPC